ncbi:iron-sulfur cluster assembly accessory protein [Candidatus Methylacidiphilum fumarolicum]|uniref:Fe-S cluster assembly scaffold protein n=2 Tax=Candidatus Methylacidiphilum fumarolicum TaxID=591154 RepID=I0JVX1_METFB|nr:iron-sulfur cluster assembly accessory protein [Candidatus Methylacidiphilum fumarolicum]MBW6415094.1 iron-sulfur cluster assembly accessory protein [Candidatus Methylacidiphilum fumarolicum]TFE67189.1 [Fe-S]-binding protein [Candidatus Methylacidiphilum fumarolicum]TFE72120.1 iron-sulfur cluster assembly accessory protein [Candidatus Methylacidiphilum fumarolicum]TFE73623.1 iron-sulfur cluster assembly accessory protein [Candidatus Methylacidiphilum fumarolicum]TFE76269.1 [Fe-S]-binding pr
MNTEVSFTRGSEKLCQITEKAALRLKEILEQSGRQEGALRISVVGGGCAGLQYEMNIVDGPETKDIMIDSKGVKLIVDPKSALFLSGSILDYSEDLLNQGFVVKNPNAVSHCSCGKSFAI